MKFSMCTAVYGMNDLHDTIDRATMHGFDAVELTAALHMPVSSPQQYRREVRGWIREAGLACSALHYIFDGSVKLATADRELNAACADAGIDPVFDADVYDAVALETCLANRTSEGGPAPQSAAAQIRLLRSFLQTRRDANAGEALKIQ